MLSLLCLKWRKRNLNRRRKDGSGLVDNTSSQIRMDVNMVKLFTIMHLNDKITHML